MRKLIWIMGLWLVGTVAAHAAEAPVAGGPAETFNYKVYWGFLRMGGAQISYLPTGNGYVVRAAVKDSSSLIDMQDEWRAQGTHTAKGLFLPEVYAVKQAENSYQADKTMVFDRKAGLVRYTNRLDAGDKAAPLPLQVNGVEARDVLSTIFAWRRNGLDEVRKAAEVPVVNIKKHVVLQREAGVRTTLKIGNREMVAWRVKMRTLKDGVPGRDTWTVYLRDEPALTPVQIVAATKFGTFRATLD